VQEQERNHHPNRDLRRDLQHGSILPKRDVASPACIGGTPKQTPKTPDGQYFADQPSGRVYIDVVIIVNGLAAR